MTRSSHGRVVLARRRGAQAACAARGDPQAAQAPDPRSGGAPRGDARRAACGWCACARRSIASRFRAPRRTRCAAAARTNSTTLLAARGRRDRAERAALRLRLVPLPRRAADRTGARLSPAAQPLARQRLPLRADLFGLRAARRSAPRRRGRQLPRARRLLRCHPWCAAATTRCPAGAAPASHLRRRRHRDARSLRHPTPRRLPMTDMRRTLLWVVFSMSLVLLWDAWNKHTGQPSMFGAGARAPAASPGAAGSRPSAPARRAGAGRRRRAGRRQRGRAARGAGRRRTGGRQREGHRHHRPGQGDVRQPRRRRWCGSNCCTHADHARPKRERGAVRPQPRSALYLAQTGLITVDRRARCPNHLTPMSAGARRRALKDGRERARAEVRVAARSTA